ncbi:MAG TPA: long-chain-fatty-acid--CoA ligase [Steroidobacteraceae bacterium]|jgi:fatty-acyl-CoA synthase
MHQAALMMNPPLLVSSILEHAAAQWGHSQIVSRETHGEVVRYSYKDFAARTRKLANALMGLGLHVGDTVATLAWNNHRHLEAYYAVSGSGLVVHTCNPRLHIDQLAYIINHAEDKVLLFDSNFAPLIEALRPLCPSVKVYVCLSDVAHAAAAPQGEPVLVYEDFIAPASEAFDWPPLDELCGAAICYTSGTTGNPKGAVFSHRGIVLNAMMICHPHLVCMSPHETILPVVPMFHVNGWCIPYGALLGGTKLVLPGPKLDGASLYELMERERVTVSAGVPTIWMGLLQHLEQNGLRFSSLKHIMSGGSAFPTALIAKYSEAFGIEVRHGWGMTETVAVATLSSLDGAQLHWPPAERHKVISKQGKSVFGVEIKVVDEAGNTLPRDGTSQGELMIRGQWVINSYFKNDVSPLRDGWFPTGDIATIDPEGVMQIRDRSKDLIKTGGEWISSLDLENAVCSHPAVAQAAVIGVRHPKWQERPLMFIVRRPDASCCREELMEYLEARVARWWLPEEVIFLESLPLGGTGKVQKAVLREKYGNVFD